MKINGCKYRNYICKYDELQLEENRQVSYNTDKRKEIHNRTHERIVA